MRLEKRLSHDPQDTTERKDYDVAIIGELKFPYLSIV